MKQIQILWLGACHAFEENQRDLFWIQLASWYFKIGRGLFDCSALQTAIKLSKSIALQLDGFEKENNKFCCFKSFPEYRNADFGYLMSVCVAAQSNIQRQSLKCELAGKKKDPAGFLQTNGKLQNAFLFDSFRALFSGAKLTWKPCCVFFLALKPRIKGHIEYSMVRSSLMRR